MAQRVTHQAHTTQDQQHPHRSAREAESQAGDSARMKPNSING